MFLEGVGRRVRDEEGIELGLGFEDGGEGFRYVGRGRGGHGEELDYCCCGGADEDDEGAAPDFGVVSNISGKGKRILKQWKR